MVALQHFLSHYWYVFAALSAGMTIGSVVWTIRAERKFRRLTMLDDTVATHQAAIRYLQADHDGRDEKTPTGFYPIAKRERRSVH